MKLPFPRHMLARSSQGAKLEDDAELTVPPVVLPHAIIGTPLDLNSPLNPTTIVDQSFISSQNLKSTGILAAQLDVFPRFGKGMWHITFNINYGFAGTANSLTTEAVRLTQPDGVATFATIWARTRVASPIHTEARYEFWYCLPDEGARFVIDRAATVAADILSIQMSMLANKLW